MRGADSPRPRPSAINPRPSHDTPMRLGIPIFAGGEVGGWVDLDFAEEGSCVHCAVIKFVHFFV